MREKFSRLIAITASLLYGLAPYHLLDLYVRGAISDSLAFVFIPLVFLAVEKIEKKPTLAPTNRGLSLMGWFVGHFCFSKNDRRCLCCWFFLKNN